MPGSPEVKSFASVNPKVAAFVERSFHPEDNILAEVRKYCELKGLPKIQVGKMDGLHLETIARACGAKRAVEIGTLGGYSGISLLRGMGASGRLYTCEIHPAHAEVARENFARAGFRDNAEILVGPALETLPKLRSKGPFDLVFVDADKLSYPSYLAWAAEALRPGGILLGDNTFAFGMLGDEKFEDAEDEATVKAIRDFNAGASSGRFRGTILPTGEGLTFAVKIR